MKTIGLSTFKKTAFSNRLNVLFFAALLFSQIVFALHHHDLQDLSSNHDCTVCSQLQATSHGLVAQQLTYCEAAASTSSFLLLNYSVSTTPTFSYSPRAPPVPSVS